MLKYYLYICIAYEKNLNISVVLGVYKINLSKQYQTVFLDFLHDP